MKNILLIFVITIFTITSYAQNSKSSIKINDPSTELPEKVYVAKDVDLMPVFPGCEHEATEDEMYKCFETGVITHIRRYITYPGAAKGKGITGRVFVAFIIGKNGVIRDVKAMNNANEILKQAAIDLVSTIPKMKPALLNGKAVAVSFTAPISYTLD